MPNLNTTIIGKLLIAKPPVAEQIAIVERIESHDDRLRAEESELAKLEALKHGLMDDLLTGRVRVPVSPQEVASDAVTE